MYYNNSYYSYVIKLIGFIQRDSENKKFVCDSKIVNTFYNFKTVVLTHYIFLFI